MTTEDTIEMSSVQEIEAAIITLSPREQRDLHAWMDEHIAAVTDAGFEMAVASGEFDDQIQQALADHQSGKTRGF